MKPFKVEYDGSYSVIVSEVYAVDSTREKFLIVDRNGRFKWVDCDDCTIYGWYEEEY